MTEKKDYERMKGEIADLRLCRCRIDWGKRTT